MTYAETIDFLFTRLPLFSRIGAAAYKKDLTNTIALCEFLDNPHQTFKTVHIAGTNGKGSVSHMLAAILQQAGYKTGLYTSPHLYDFRERIRINGEMVSKEFVIRFTDKIKPQIDTVDPSFFEITVAMAFSYFAEEQVDIAIIETGLGGRLDSTNIITPELAIITNIGWDHMNLLGDTLEKIAAEKAGIIKQNIPVVLGEVLPETEMVFRQVAAGKQAPVTIAAREWQIADWKWEKHELIVEAGNKHQQDHHLYHLDLPGIYQTKNLLTVLASCSQLRQKGWKIDDTAIQKGLQHTRKLTGLHGRWEILQRSPLVVADVAHNEDGIKQLVQQIELTPHNNLHLVVGMVKDKDLDRVLNVLPKHAHYYFTRAHIPRALPEEELLQKAELYGLKGNVYPDVNTALKKALSAAMADDLVIVCGSIFLVGELLPVAATAESK